MSAAATPPAKRQRVDDTSDNSGLSISISEDLWFHDGNVVLQAEQTRFRVHRSILERRSTVFKDMFSLPQPPVPSENEPMVDGCPLIYLSDSATDVAAVLGILYEGLRDIWDPTANRCLPSHHVAAMVRLGRKYDIPSMYRTALSYLKNDFPATLAGWDTSLHSRRLVGLDVSDDTVPINILNLADELGFYQIMPAAFLHYMNCTSKSAIFANSTAQPLNPELHIRCLLARERLILWLSHRRSTIIVRHFGAHSEWSCCDHRGIVFFHELEIWNILAGLSTMLRPWSDVEGTPNGKLLSRLCKKCQDRVMAHSNSVREQVWRMLPSFLGLDSWDVLVKESTD